MCPDFLRLWEFRLTRLNGTSTVPLLFHSRVYTINNNREICLWEHSVKLEICPVLTLETPRRLSGSTPLTHTHNRQTFVSRRDHCRTLRQDDP